MIFDAVSDVQVDLRLHKTVYFLSWPCGVVCCVQQLCKSARCAQNCDESARENKMGNVGNNVTFVTVVSVRSLPKKRS